MHKSILLLLLTLIVGAACGQQVADTDFKAEIENPAYPVNQGSIVLIDEAHHNFHTAGGRYQPFADVLRADGYVVRGSSGPFTMETLATGKILVIANAIHESNRDNWSLPTPSAFTVDEIAAVNEWVKNGGSLFLIADHMPFPGAANDLASSFGFKFFNGFAIKRGDNFFKSGSGLQTSKITQGRNANESINSIQTFTGSAFEMPEGAQCILMLDNDYILKMPKVAWQFPIEATETRTGENLSQGAYVQYGKGRVVVFGEAAMFSAQKNGMSKMGMNKKSASQNIQLLLNIVHWLGGLIE
jgi:hypothetical protein